jgi:hypothetical protein
MSASAEFECHPSEDVLRKSFASSNLARVFLEAFGKGVSHGEVSGAAGWKIGEILVV